LNGGAQGADVSGGGAEPVTWGRVDRIGGVIHLKDGTPRGAYGEREEQGAEEICESW